MAPGYLRRWPSSHDTDSASRWLVGSSSSSKSGWSSSSRHSATRRRSPPESFVTSESSAAQRVHRLIDLAVEIPQTRGLDLVLQFGHLVGGLVGIIDRQFIVAIEDRLLFGDAQHDVLAHGLGGVELRFLLEVADPRALGDPRLAVIFLVEAGHDPQQRRFTGAVDAEHADLGVGIKRQMDVIEYLAVAGIGLGQTLHEIDELTGHRDP